MNWDGLVILNKSEGDTSHKIVQLVKERLKVSKAGHLGTLDPLATGVFPVCLGKATRLSHFYMKADKCYLTAIRFGFFTSTDDREGHQEGPFRKCEFSQEQLKTALATFQGEYDQRPPMYSAKKIKGQKAYHLARKGLKPNLPLQRVQIYEIKLIHFEKDIATVYIHCSSGTYVRSIARELGMRLRCGAHVHELTRTKFGNFTLDQACPPEVPIKELEACFIPLENMLNQFPELVINPELSRRILSGSAIQVNESFPEEWVRIFSEDKALLAIAQVLPQESSLRIQPKIVFN
jgi:tRNA pseudouridine55 synthase